MTMDRRRRADLEEAQMLGRLSDEMVFSLGRVLRDELNDEDLEVLARAAELFEQLGSDEASLGPESPGAMFRQSSYLDALQVVEHRVEGEDEIEGYTRHLAELLRRVIERRGAREEESPVLESLRDVFVEVGEATLARAGDLSLPQTAHWPPARQAT
jgi:hypothetical protein